MAQTHTNCVENSPLFVVITWVVNTLEDTSNFLRHSGNVDIVWQWLRTWEKRHVITQLNSLHILYVQFTTDQFQPRTRATHETQCKLLHGPLHDHNTTTYGLHRNSILNTSKYFLIIDGLAPDIMHDILKGSLQYEVKELLKHFIYVEKYFSLDLFLMFFLIN